MAVTYYVENIAGQNVLQLNEIQLEDLVRRIKNIYRGTEHEKTTYKGINECLELSNFRIIKIDKRP